MLPAIAQLLEQLDDASYIADEELATALYLATAMGRPLLIEGEAGVGKTELAKVLARLLGTRLIRLQCYEGLDASAALYEWNYLKQILEIKAREGAGGQASKTTSSVELFTDAFLLKRPLLEAITEPDRPPVLLIDEVDRADEEFEAFLLELLSDFQVTIPELGTVQAVHRPHVILTSNRTRELSDALRRRCLYLWLEYPGFEREQRIIAARVPGVPALLAEQIAGVMQALREQQLNKPPGIAESLDWAVALMTLNRETLDPQAVQATLSCILKDAEDLRLVRGPWLAALLQGMPAPGAGPGEWSRLAARISEGRP